MHSRSISHRSTPRRVSARIALVALLAGAAAAPAHAGKASTDNSRAPVIAGTAPTVVEVGRMYSFRPIAMDPDGNRLKFRVSNLPGWASFSKSTGTLTGTPGPNKVGRYRNIQVRVTDGKHRTALPPFDITVVAPGTVPPPTTTPEPVNHAPTISGSPATGATVGLAYTFQPAAADADGDRLTFSIRGNPSWLSINSADGSLTGIPAAANVGTASGIVISVSDGTATTSLPAFNITVSQTNRAPTISGSPATSATVGQAYTFQPAAADADGDRLAFNVRGNPSWLSINSADGTLTGTPAAANVGTASGIVISVSDGTATTSLPAFTITVAQTNRAPTISGSPATGATVGQAYTFRPTAADADGDSLTFSVRGNPSWLSINSADGTLSGTPAAANVGTASGIVISVSDGTATTSLAAFTITVSQTNRAPTISGSPATSATVGQAYTFRPTAADADGDSLTFSVRGNPAWLSINSNDGTLAGIPAAANVGTASGIVISVSDGTATTSLPAFNITVAQTNRAPTISGSPATGATVGQAYTFRPTAADADGDSLTFSVRGNPAWLSINSTDGTLAGIPAAANVGTASGIVISVSDGTVSTSLPAFAITVAQTNRAPTISGSPVTNARAGQPYAFRPTAADADGDRLTFSVRGNPSWLSINSADGTLSGTPAAANVGTASGIVISVSDGTATTSLPAFSITVAAALTTSVRVSWRAPATNEDGTPVSGLTGFRVFYGNVSGQYSQNLLASSPGITSVVIEGLTSSTTWYFVVKALAAGGVESDYSTEVSKAL